MNESNYNKINNNFTQLSKDDSEEMKRKVEDYKISLNEELNKIIKEEKEKEDERMKKYTEEADDRIKQILQDAITKDRMESSKRVMRFNE